MHEAHLSRPVRFSLSAVAVVATAADSVQGARSAGEAEPLTATDRTRSDVRCKAGSSLASHGKRACTKICAKRALGVGFSLLNRVHGGNLRRIRPLRIKVPSG